MEKVKTTKEEIKLAAKEEIKPPKDETKAPKDEIKPKDEINMNKEELKPTEEIKANKDELQMQDEIGTAEKEEVKAAKEEPKTGNEEMAPAYKVTYFDITALAEPIRFLLSYGGIDFEDNRISKDKWPALKPSMPYGQMPVLEHNGKVAHQSLAICRYLAKQVKLIGKDDWEDLEIDAAVDTFNDVRLRVALYHYEQDEKTKEAKAGPLFSEFVPFYLERLDSQAKNNNGYLAAGRLTWADLYFIGLLDYINFMAKKDIIADYPNLVTVRENVTKIPNIKSWIEKRPKENL